MITQFTTYRLRIVLCILLSTLFITSCHKDDIPQNKKVEFYGLTDNNQLIKYSGGHSLREGNSISLTGLESGEKIVAIDFRPATGQLYGVSNLSRIYIINHITGASAAVGADAFTSTINGTTVGFDFNPTVDRIRLVTDNQQNIRLNPETGAVAAIDGSLNPDDPGVGAVAYSNNVAGASATTLYDIDVERGKLYIQNPPNDGRLVEVGELGLIAAGESGFDISTENSIALAVLNGVDDDKSEGTKNNGYSGNKSRFYEINLQTGKATNIGKSDRKIIGLAIPTSPVAYAVNATNNLLTFNPFNTGTIVTKPITGLQPGENILGIDMRPANGQMFALGSSNRIYTLNLASGAATSVNGPFTPALSGEYFGFDFNPTVDRIRVVSNTGQNLRLHPETGMVAFVDGNLNPGTPQVDASAYTNNFPGATTTTLYAIDYSTNQLFTQNPPNAGTLVLVGGLDLDVDAQNGFDIGGTSGKAYGILRKGGSSAIYSINLGTGKAKKVSNFSVAVNSFSIGLGF